MTRRFRTSKLGRVSRRSARPVGRIPFRIRIGVTGHRNLKSSPALAEVPAQVRRLLPVSATTPVRFGAVSALAEGADRLVVEQVFDYAARN